jgi:hypothetical protein
MYLIQFLYQIDYLFLVIITKIDVFAYYNNNNNNNKKGSNLKNV